MVAHLVRLKLTLLRNMLRRSRAQAIGVVLAIVYFGFLVVAVAVAVIVGVVVHVDRGGARGWYRTAG